MNISAKFRGLSDAEVELASTPNFIHPQTLVFQHLRDSFSIQGGNGVATF